MRLAFLVAAVSASVLGYELALMRALSLAWWHHFAYMVVSVALLGFGVSGTVLWVGRRWLVRQRDGALSLLAAAFAVALPASFALSQRVPFDIFQLAWDRWQFVSLALHYLVLFAPFLLGASCLGLAFVCEAGRAHGVYFWNLLGSAVGAAGAVGLMWVVPPERLPLLACALAGLGAVVHGGWNLRALGALGATGAALVFFGIVVPLEVDISQYKTLPGLLDAGARVLEVRHGPLGTVHVVEGSTIHLVSGRSMAYQGEEPEQRALVIDGDAASAINHLASPDQALAFDYTTSALPYYLLEEPATLIVGAGGGSDVVLARHHEARQIVALEMNPQVVDLMVGSQADFAQHIYEAPGVELVCDEARGYLARTTRRFDLIQLPLVESFGPASAGVYALSENYLYTVEAVELYLDRLSPGGMVAITRWLKTPPNDAIRIFATVTEALLRRGVADPGRHVVFIRGWSTATIVASPSALKPEQVEAVREFCRERSFDLVWVDGMRLEEANRYHKLPRAECALAARKLLSAERERFLRESPFDLRPTTDDRPYHSLTMGLRGLMHLRERFGDQWVRFAEWGYLVLVASVAQAAVLGLVLIVVPLLCVGARAEGAGSKACVLVYFACLGVGYMFIEIVMIQKLSLFLASPVYSAAVVLGAFMVFSGLGSLASGRIGRGPLAAARLGASGTVLAGLLLWLALDHLLEGFSGSRLGVRAAVAVGAAGFLAFFMGMPFPSGLRILSGPARSLTPWAWGVNGYGSVVGAALAMLAAVGLGFRAVLLIAFALYVVAGWVCGGLVRGSAEGPGE